MNKTNSQIQITGLSQEISTQDLSEALEHIGHVISLVLNDSEKKVFIEFESPEDAELAMKVLKGFEFFGRELNAEILE